MKPKRTILTFAARPDRFGEPCEMKWTDHGGDGRRRCVELVEDGLVLRGSVCIRDEWITELELRRASRDEPFTLGATPVPFREAVVMLREMELGDGAPGFEPTPARDASTGGA